LKIVLTTIFSLSLISISGCITLGDRPEDIEWEYPPKPVTEKLDLKRVDGGYFLSRKESEKLANNLEAQRAYTKKLEALIKKMEEHYEK
jgi:hypothetical protein